MALQITGFLTSNVQNDISTMDENQNIETKNTFKHNLITLHEEIKTQRITPYNVLVYFNIMAEVFVIISQKEANKMFKAIKYSLNNFKTDSDLIDFKKKIHQLRILLLIFRSVFECIIISIKKNWQIDLRQNIYKQKLKSKLDYVINTMKIPKSKTRTKSFKNKILPVMIEKLKTEFNELDSVFSGPEKFDFLMFEYYMMDPILNIFGLIGIIDKNII